MPGAATTIPDPTPPLRLAGEGGSDEKLVQRFKAGDDDALDALVDRHTSALLNYLRRLVHGNVQVAEDLHQATWLSVLEHFNQFDESARGPGFKPWVFRIATNKANDHFRRHGREQRRLSRVAADPTLRPQPADDVDSVAIDEETATRLRDIVQSLPDPQRRVVELRCFAGLKFTEIAQTLGCPLNTALGRMHKAVKKLRVALDEPQ